MKRVILAAILTGAMLLSNAVPSYAQLLLDQTLSGSVGAGTELGAVNQPPASAEDIERHLAEQGYTNIRVSPTNPHQYTALSPDGIPLLLTIEARTGKIVAAMPQ